MSELPIKGGFVLLSRKLLNSGLMEKPPLYMKLWVWMLMQASFKDHGGLKRGQFFSSYPRMAEAMAYKVGYRTVMPTKRKLEGVTKYLTKVHMVVTSKVLHGMVITILNYSHYQDITNYEGANERADSGANDVLILRKKGIKKENNTSENFSFSSLKSRYSHPDLIDQAFSAIASTRRAGRVADSVLLAQLQKWEQYPVEQVETSIRTYLAKDCAGQGKGEKYLLGIIRNQKPAAPKTPAEQPENLFKAAWF